MRVMSSPPGRINLLQASAQSGRFSGTKEHMNLHHHRHNMTSRVLTAKQLPFWVPGGDHMTPQLVLYLAEALPFRLSLVQELLQ